MYSIIYDCTGPELIAQVSLCHPVQGPTVPLSAGLSMPSGSCPFVPAQAVSSRESSTDIPGLTDSEYGTTICKFHVPEAKPANISGSTVADVPRIVLNNSEGMFNFIFLVFLGMNTYIKNISNFNLSTVCIYASGLHTEGE